MYALPRHLKTCHGLHVLTVRKHHGVQEIRKAAKKAADFELRKVVKRLKAARSVMQLFLGSQLFMTSTVRRGEKPAKVKAKDDDPAELERQLELLKVPCLWNTCTASPLTFDISNSTLSRLRPRH